MTCRTVQRFRRPLVTPAWGSQSWRRAGLQAGFWSFYISQLNPALTGGALAGLRPYTAFINHGGKPRPLGRGGAGLQAGFLVPMHLKKSRHDCPPHLPWIMVAAAMSSVVTAILLYGPSPTFGSGRACDRSGAAICENGLA